MRQITRQACQAFENGENFYLSNTRVENNAMYLWGNKIAFKQDGKLFVSLCGYNTNTTRERLNGLTGVSVCSKNFTPYINGVEVSSFGVYEVNGNEVVKVDTHYIRV